MSSTSTSPNSSSSPAQPETVTEREKAKFLQTEHRLHKDALSLIAVDDIWQGMEDETRAVDEFRRANHERIYGSRAEGNDGPPKGSDMPAPPPGSRQLVLGNIEEHHYHEVTAGGQPGAPRADGRRRWLWPLAAALGLGGAGLGLGLASLLGGGEETPPAPETRTEVQERILERDRREEIEILPPIIDGDAPPAPPELPD